MISAPRILEIPVVRSEVIYVRVTSVTNLVLWVENATHHRAVAMTQTIRQRYATLATTFVAF